MRRCLIVVINSIIPKKSADNLEELYDSTRSSESDNRVSLKDIDDNYPKLFNEGNLASVLEAAKRKRVRESKE